MPTPAAWSFFLSICVGRMQSVFNSMPRPPHALQPAPLHLPQGGYFSQPPLNASITGMAPQIVEPSMSRQ